MRQGMNTNDAGRKDARRIIDGLGWPSDIPVERLVASVYNTAMENGMIESAVILAFTFDRAELSRRVTREKRLATPTLPCMRGLYEAIRQE